MLTVSASDRDTDNHFGVVSYGIAGGNTVSYGLLVMRQINPRARPVVFGRKQGEGNTRLTGDKRG